jgi:hypothetical protein
MHAVMVWLSTLPAFVMLLTREASGASRSSSDTSAVVYLFRHCVRSIDETDLAKYASHSLLLGSPMARVCHGASRSTRAWASTFGRR